MRWIVFDMDCEVGCNADCELDCEVYFEVGDQVDCDVRPSFCEIFSERSDNLESHRGLRNRRDVAPNIDPILTTLPKNVNVQNAPAPHLGSLLTDKLGSRRI